MWLGLVAAMALLALKAGPLFWTGDEPRYCSLAIGLIHAHLDPAPADWLAFVNREGLDYRSGDLGPHGRPIVSAWLSLLYAPLLSALGLAAARWLSFVAIAAGLWLLGLTLARRFAPGAAGGRVVVAVSLASAGLSVPVMEYSHLVYPEAILFALVALALYGIAAERPAYVLAAAWVAPFVHIRALPLAAVLFAVAILRARGGGRGPLLRTSFVAAAFCAAFVAEQSLVYGKLGGLAFLWIAPTLGGVPVRIGMQLFEARHGLVTLWPLGLVALAGLIAGTLARDRLCRVTGAALLAYGASVLFANASESYGGRFWVAAMPMLAVGVAAWLDRATANARLAATPVFILTMFETIVYELDPGRFLDDRRGSHVFDALARIVPIDLTRFLPLDRGAVGAEIGFDAPIAPAMAWFTVVTLALVIAVRARPGRGRRAAIGATVLTLLVPLVLGAERTVDLGPVAVRDGGGALVTRVFGPVDAVHIGTAKIWSTPPFPRRFTLTCRDERLRFSIVTPAREAIAIPRCPAGASLAIASDDPDTARPFDRAFSLAAYERLL